MLEAELSRRFTDYVKSQNGLVLNITGSKYQKAGTPDLWITHNYTRGLWIELKVDRNKVTPIQKAMMDSINAKGSTAIVLRYTTQGYSLERPDGTVIENFEDFRELWQFLCTRQTGTT